MGKLDECNMGEFGRLERSERKIAILGDRWRPQTAKQEGDKIGKHFRVLYGKSVMSAQMFEVSLLGVGAVLRLDAWPMAKRLRPATHEYTPPVPAVALVMQHLLLSRMWPTNGAPQWKRDLLNIVCIPFVFHAFYGR